MATKMDSVVTKFDRYHWMAIKMHSVAPIKWWPKPFWLPSNLVIAFKWRPKKGNITNLFLLVSITQKDGQFKKIWSPSNHHNFSDGKQRFLVTKKEGMPLVSKNLSIKVFQKRMTTLFVAIEKKIGHHFKNNDSRMAIEDFQLPHLVPFHN